MRTHDPFGALLPLLVDEIPRAVGVVAKGEPICRIILWYYDTSAPCCYFLADAIPASHSGRVAGRFYLQNHSPEGAKRIEAMIGHDPALPSFSLFAQVYQLLCTKGQMDAAFERFRTFAQSLALELNGVDWSPHCCVTDDFVIYPLNGTD